MTAVDNLAAAGSWDLVHAEEVGPGTVFGYTTQRWYVVDADPDKLVAWTAERLSAAGFSINADPASREWCGRRPADATPDIACSARDLPACSRLTVRSPLECFVNANGGVGHISVKATDRGQKVTYVVGSELHYLSVPDRIIVLVGIEYY